MHYDLSERISTLKLLVRAPACDARSLLEQAKLHAARIAKVSKVVLENHMDMVDRYNVLNQLLVISDPIKVRLYSLENNVLPKKAVAGSSNCDGESSKLKVPETKTVQRKSKC